MEKSLLPLKSISDSRMSLSSMFVPTDMTFAIMCGVGLFILLIPFLKTYPESPLGSKKNTPKVVKRGQVKTRKRTAAVKGGRNGRKNLADSHNASRPVEIPTEHPLLDSTPHAFWNSKEKMDHLPLSQLLSYSKVLEDLIQQKFSQLFWGMSSVFSESVVATALVSKTPSSEALKTVKFRDTSDTFPPLPLAQGPPQVSQAQPLPHQHVAPSLLQGTQGQGLDNHLSSTPNQTLSSSQSRTCGTACPTTETRMQASLPTERPNWQQGLNWKGTVDTNLQKCQAAVTQPSHIFPRGISPTEAARSASILPEQCQVLQHQEEPQIEDRVTKMRQKRGAPFRFRPSREIRKLQKAFLANSPSQSRNRPDLSQPAKSSILDSRSCKLSPMTGSVPSRTPLKKGPAKCNTHDHIKEALSVGAKDLPSTSSNTLEEDLEPGTPSLRIEQLSYVNTTQNLYFLDPKTQMKLESNIAQLPLKHRKRAQGASRAEYYSKAAIILEKLHHRDPGGTRVGTVSSTRLQGPPFAHWPSELWETQRAPPPAASHGPPKAHPDAQERHLGVWGSDLCLQAKTQQGSAIQGTGRCSLQPTTSPRKANHAEWQRSEKVASGHPCQSGTMGGPQERLPSFIVKQSITLEVKDKAHPAWQVNLGSREIPLSPALNTGGFEHAEANRSPGHFQTPSPQHSIHSALNPQVLSGDDFQLNEQPQLCFAGFLPEGQGPVYPATVSLPSEDSLPRSENRSPNHLQTPQGFGDVFMRTDHSQETRELRVSQDKTPEKAPKVCHPDGERTECMRDRAKSQGEMLESTQTSQACVIDTSTQLDNIASADSQSSPDMPGKLQALTESCLKEIIKNILQYLSLSTEDKEQGHPLKNEGPPSSTVQTQEAVTGEKLFCSMPADVQNLTDIVVQILLNWLGLKLEDPSKEQWCKLEALTSHLGCSTHSCEGLCDRSNRPESKMSYGHTSPEAQNHPLLNGGVDPQLNFHAQRTSAQQQNRQKKGIVCDQPCSPGQNRDREIGEGQQSGIATETACDPELNRVKYRMGCGAHTISQRQDHPFKYREIGDKRQPGVAAQKAYGPRKTLPA
ncbi:spermatogenesis-associated protein 31E1-like [Psammomys obesus]|uniref:spermatogenesis-associated protein 31E1-like n=1 Tax=Psammomys obesus TaxID=48139 RepID=UPI002452C45C|nr:spermatogenesis-associated protein 31E1-like [Psammomys obesus]